MRDYQIRLLYEIARYPNTLFVTFTFDDENLKRFENDPNRSVRLFLDRVRKRFGKSVRHWFCAEFGTLHGRLHYHGLLFNIEPFFDPKELESLWSYGFINFQLADDKAAKYVSKYVTKSYSNGKKPPRVISSKGIGAGYLDPKNVGFHVGKDGVYRPYLLYGSFKVPLPRYYYSKVFSEDDKINMLIDRTLNPPPMIVNGEKYYTEREYREALYLYHKSQVDLGLSPKKKKKEKFNFQLDRELWQI